MHLTPHHGLGPRLPDDQLTRLWRSGTRLAARAAIAFGLSALTAIWIGAAATGNAFAQILVTAFAALALWVPFFLGVLGIERLLQRRRPSAKVATAKAPVVEAKQSAANWRRLARLAPGQAERIAVLERSLERSRLALGKAQLDPDAIDLCVLIDRRLPELIGRELDDLPPDDRDRGRRVKELVDLIEQFARHCGRKGSGETSLPRYDSEVLRRRFEERLSEPF